MTPLQQTKSMVFLFSRRAERLEFLFRPMLIFEHFCCQKDKCLGKTVKVTKVGLWIFISKFEYVTSFFFSTIYCCFAAIFFFLFPISLLVSISRYNIQSISFLPLLCFDTVERKVREILKRNELKKNGKKYFFWTHILAST